jgi:hypothetical protein
MMHEKPPEVPGPDDPLRFWRGLVIALVLCLWAASALMVLAAVILRAHHG